MSEYAKSDMRSELSGDQSQPGPYRTSISTMDAVLNTEILKRHAEILSRMIVIF